MKLCQSYPALPYNTSGPGIESRSAACWAGTEANVLTTTVSPLSHDHNHDLLKAFDVCQWFMQDQNVACRWTCARPSRNLASTRGDGKCRVDAHEIHTCLYNMTITLRVKLSVKRSEQSYVLETVMHKN